MLEEWKRLRAAHAREENWQRWGPYLSERQWGTVREDYSETGDCWTYFPFEHAGKRTYRWGEDGILGVCDRECRLCFSVALWNHRDPILKERLYGLNSHEGNHGEDVKEEYHYLDSNPTHSYFKGAYRYPQAEFPYDRLRRENARRGRNQPEFELADTGVFDEDRYFDVVAEYAKGDPNDLLIRITVRNCGPEAAQLTLLPTLWYRNTWVWGCRHEGCTMKPTIRQHGEGGLRCTHQTLEPFLFQAEPQGDDDVRYLFTENETNVRALYGGKSYTPYVKDAFERYVVHGDDAAVSPKPQGTKVAAHYEVTLAAGESRQFNLRLWREDLAIETPFGEPFEAVLHARKDETDQFYDSIIDPELTDDERLVVRQGYAGLLWTKQFYHYVVADWLSGDLDQPPPPAARLKGRNNDWHHLFNRDLISMPDKWEYPWYASWDLAFQMIPFCRIDPLFAKDQLILMLREWYMHPNGQIPSYEFALDDITPPVHAWAAWEVYRLTGKQDGEFLARVFQKLLLNFTWWVNRKDPDGNHVFSGGFMGMDNVGVFDRSRGLPFGKELEQADATAWMAFYCTSMLTIALELGRKNRAAADMASKFFEHFVAIADATNAFGEAGLWDEEDGFYYDQIISEGSILPLRLRSMVGMIPLLAVDVLRDDVMDDVPEFRKRMQWFLDNRKDLGRRIERLERDGKSMHLLAVAPKERMLRVLARVLDENEFLSPFGIRSLSRYYEKNPYILKVGGQSYEVKYAPAESDSPMFGGNSNWRGPIWLPLNFLIINALRKYHGFYGDTLHVECPSGSGNRMTLGQVADEIASRVAKLFTITDDGERPYAGGKVPRDDGRVLFHEYFNPETGRGLGASHQTGWTALVTDLINPVF